MNAVELPSSRSYLTDLCNKTSKQGMRWSGLGILVLTHALRMLPLGKGRTVQTKRMHSPGMVAHACDVDRDNFSRGRIREKDIMA